MENQVLAEFVRVLKIGRSSRIEAPLLQYLSIMIQNMDSEHAICEILVCRLNFLNFYFLSFSLLYLSANMDLGFWEEDYRSYDHVKEFFFSS